MQKKFCQVNGLFFRIGGSLKTVLTFWAATVLAKYKANLIKLSIIVADLFPRADGPNRPEDTRVALVVAHGVGEAAVVGQAYSGIDGSSELSYNARPRQFAYFVRIARA